MNKELIVILAAMLETDYGLCSNCVGFLTKKKTPNHYIRLIASIPL